MRLLRRRSTTWLGDLFAWRLQYQHQWRKWAHSDLASFCQQDRTFWEWHNRTKHTAPFLFHELWKTPLDWWTEEAYAKWRIFVKTANDALTEQEANFWIWSTICDILKAAAHQMRELIRKWANTLTIHIVLTKWAAAIAFFILIFLIHKLIWELTMHFRPFTFFLFSLLYEGSNQKLSTLLLCSFFFYTVNENAPIIGTPWESQKTHVHSFWNFHCLKKRMPFARCEHVESIHALLHFCRRMRIEKRRVLSRHWNGSFSS